MKTVKFDDVLPLESFAYHNTTGEIIKIKKGETGYYKLENQPFETVEKINEIFDVSKEQAEAMFQASMFGWDVPASNPQLWAEEFEKKGEIVFSHNRKPSWIEEGK